MDMDITASHFLHEKGFFPPRRSFIPQGNFLPQGSLIHPLSAPAALVLLLLSIFLVFLQPARVFAGTAVPVRTDEYTMNLVQGSDTLLPSTYRLVDRTGQKISDQPITWASDRQDLAAVSGSQVSALAPGNAILTGTSGGQTISRVTVTVLQGEFLINADKLQLKKGKKFTLTASLGGKKVQVRYRSSKRKVATVSKEGVLKAKKPGKTTITITAGSQVKKCKVTVTADKTVKAAAFRRFLFQKDGRAWGIEPNVSSLVMKKGTRFRLTTALTNGTGEKVKSAYTSSKPEVATVSRNGLLKAKKAGKTIITAVWGKVSCRIAVQVRKRTDGSQVRNFLMTGDGRTAGKLELNMTDIRTFKGRTYQLVCAFGKKPAYGAVFTSDDPAVASVDGNGLVTAVAPGSSVIRASWNGLQAACTIEVEAGNPRRDTVSSRFSFDESGNYQESSAPVVRQNYPRVVLIGSSTFRRWKNARTNSQESFPGCQVINMGIGGSVVADWNTPEKEQEIIAQDPDVLVVHLGQNNIRNETTDDLSNGREAASLVIRFVLDLRAALPDVPVYVVSVLQVPLKNQAVAEIDEADRMLQEFCRNNPDMAFIDMRPYFYDAAAGVYRQELFKDRIHPNDDGFQVWTNVVGYPIAGALYPD